MDKDKVLKVVTEIYASHPGAAPSFLVARALDLITAVDLAVPVRKQFLPLDDSIPNEHSALDEATRACDRAGEAGCETSCLGTPLLEMQFCKCTGCSDEHLAGAECGDIADWLFGPVGQTALAVCKACLVEIVGNWVKS